MIAAERVTSNLNHIDLPLTYIHQQSRNGSIKSVQCPSRHLWAKHLAARNNYTCKRFHPPHTSEHHKLLTERVPLS